MAEAWYLAMSNGGPKENAIEITQDIDTNTDLALVLCPE